MLCLPKELVDVIIAKTDNTRQLLDTHTIFHGILDRDTHHTIKINHGNIHTKFTNMAAIIRRIRQYKPNLKSLTLYFYGSIEESNNDILSPDLFKSLRVHVHFSNASQKAIPVFRNIQQAIPIIESLTLYLGPLVSPEEANSFIDIITPTSSYHVDISHRSQLSLFDNQHTMRNITSICFMFSYMINPWYLEPIHINLEHIPDTTKSITLQASTPNITIRHVHRLTHLDLSFVSSPVGFPPILMSLMTSTHPLHLRTITMNPDPSLMRINNYIYHLIINNLDNDAIHYCIKAMQPDMHFKPSIVPMIHWMYKEKHIKQITLIPECQDGVISAHIVSRYILPMLPILKILHTTCKCTPPWRPRRTDLSPTAQLDWWFSRGD